MPNIGSIKGFLIIIGVILVGVIGGIVVSNDTVRRARDFYTICVPAQGEAVCKLRAYTEYGVRFTD